MNYVSTGRSYEEKAAAFLEKQGFLVLERNFRCRQGEVDIVGIHEKCLVFVEVKYRKDKRSGLPEEAVGAGKQMKICRVSDYFRIRYRNYESLQVRYDVIAILGNEITWHKNAFSYQGKGMSW
ncbi:MAG: YraN family protein [Lachnospiraceae bacterium]|nr:YraN family protein [Lachnospiraceae bacterium]